MRRVREHWQVVTTTGLSTAVGFTASLAMFVTLPWILALLLSAWVIPVLFLAGVCVGALWEDEWRPVR